MSEASRTVWHRAPDHSRADTREQIFPFGENWERFLSRLTPGQIAAAADSLRDFLGEPDLRGKRFLDIGSGSGLFSYAAAVLLGAAEVVSLDADPAAVACTRELWRRAGKPSHWTVRAGSILDPKFTESLGAADVVYAWGVLHHTGRLWEALAETVRLVRPGGVLYLAIYNRVGGLFGSRFFWHVKRWYVRATPRQQSQARALFRFLYGVRNVLRGASPFPSRASYAAAKRGMDWETNIHDWLGGFPYEYASGSEVTSFVTRHFPDFTLVNQRVARGLANSQYLFRRAAGETRSLPLPPRVVPATISILLPAYNEEAVIERVIHQTARLVECFAGGEVIVVDDGSTDQTGPILLKLREQYPFLRVLVNERNRGHGPALARAYRAAGSDFVFHTDSDDQIPVEDFWELWRALKTRRLDLVIGVRQGRKEGIARQLLSRIVRLCVLLLFRQRLLDSNSPFRLWRASALARLLPLLPAAPVVTSVVLAVAAARLGCSVGWVPVRHIPRQTGKSFLRSWRVFSLSLPALRELVAFRRRLAYSAHPR